MSLVRSHRNVPIVKPTWHLPIFDLHHLDVSALAFKRAVIDAGRGGLDTSHLHFGSTSPARRVLDDVRT